jgi:hypothetical protein
MAISRFAGFKRRADRPRTTILLKEINVLYLRAFVMAERKLMLAERRPAQAPDNS